MLPGRELINEIERALDELDADEWELSATLEDYILENGEELLEEWKDIQNGSLSEESKREKLNILFDSIQADVNSEIDRLESKLAKLNEIDDELEKLTEWEEEE